jgi:hypothetical protein
MMDSLNLGRRKLCLLVLLLMPCVAGCGESAEAIEGRARIDFDTQVETTWKKNWDWVEGVTYLEKGGLYFDTGDPGDPTFDRSHVLPLLKRISATHGMKWKAVVDRKDRSFALAIIGQYPDVEGVQKAVRDSLEKEQKSFPIDILIQEGNRWLSIDFMNPDDSRFLEEGWTRK